MFVGVVVFHHDPGHQVVEIMTPEGGMYWQLRESLESAIKVKREAIFSRDSSLLPDDVLGYIREIEFNGIDEESCV